MKFTHTRICGQIFWEERGGTGRDSLQPSAGKCCYFPRVIPDPYLSQELLFPLRCAGEHCHPEGCSRNSSHHLNLSPSSAAAISPFLIQTSLFHSLCSVPATFQTTRWGNGFNDNSGHLFTRLEHKNNIFNSFRVGTDGIRIHHLLMD